MQVTRPYKPIITRKTRGKEPSFQGIPSLFDLRLNLSALIGQQRSRAQMQTSHCSVGFTGSRWSFPIDTSYAVNNTFNIFNPFNVIYDCDVDTLETSICMVYNTKGMVLIAARMMEKIHLEGKQVEQRGASFFTR